MCNCPHPRCKPAIDRLVGQRHALPLSFGHFDLVGGPTVGKQRATIFPFYPAKLLICGSRRGKTGKNVALLSVKVGQRHALPKGTPEIRAYRIPISGQ
jgi:hypothetical protein